MGCSAKTPSASGFGGAVAREYKGSGNGEEKKTTLQLVLCLVSCRVCRCPYCDCDFLQVLHPQKKVRADFFPSTTVLQVYEHVMLYVQFRFILVALHFFALFDMGSAVVAVHSLSKLAKFDLVAGFPPKPVTDPNQTLKEANLIGASIQQRVA